MKSASVGQAATAEMSTSPSRTILGLSVGVLLNVQVPLSRSLLLSIRTMPPGPTSKPPLVGWMVRTSITAFSPMTMLPSLKLRFELARSSFVLLSVQVWLGSMTSAAGKTIRLLPAASSVAPIRAYALALLAASMALATVRLPSPLKVTVLASGSPTTNFAPSITTAWPPTLMLMSPVLIALPSNAPLVQAPKLKPL